MSYQYNQPFEHVNMQALVDGTNSNGVMSGLAVTERGAGQNQSVDVALGKCNVDSVKYTEAGTVNVPLDAAHGTLARKDLIYYDTATGNPAQTAGTAGASPVPPDIPSGDILLAVVNRSANDNTIANTDIDDGRVYVDPLPSGLIMMWHGLIAAIPSGWTLCDGTSSTPDLRSSFIRGAPAATEAGGTGGADTHTLSVAEMPAHTHIPTVGTTGAGDDGTLEAANSPSNPMVGQATSSTGGGTAHNNMPAYYQILFIMKL